MCKECSVKRLIFSSSTTVVLNRDPSTSTVSDDSMPPSKNPMNAYVATKGLAETLVREANGEGDLRTCALRLGGLMGGGKENPLMQGWASSSARQIGNGKFIMGFTILDSAAKLHLVAERYLAKDIPCSDTNVFNIVSFNKSYGELMSFFSQEITGKPPRKLPLWLCRMMGVVNEAVFHATGFPPFGVGVTSAALDFLTEYVCSVERTEKELGWVEERPWEELIRKEIAKYQGKC